MLKIRNFSEADSELMGESSALGARMQKFERREHGKTVSQFFRDLKDYAFAVRALDSIVQKENYYKTVVYKGERLSAWESIMRARSDGVLASEMETRDWLFSPHYQNILEEARRTVGQMAVKIREAGHLCQSLMESAKSRLRFSKLVSDVAAGSAAAITGTSPVWIAAAVSSAMGQSMGWKELEVIVSALPLVYIVMGFPAIAAYSRTSDWLGKAIIEPLRATYNGAIETANRLAPQRE